MLACGNAPNGRRPSASDHVEARRGQLRRVLWQLCGRRSAQRYSIRTFVTDPAQLTQPLQERAETGCTCSSAVASMKYADTGRTRSAAARAPQRPRRRRATHNTEKFPPPHVRPHGSGDGIVAAQTPTLIGAKPAFADARSNAGRLIGPSRTPIESGIDHWRPAVPPSAPCHPPIADTHATATRSGKIRSAGSFVVALPLRADIRSGPAGCRLSARKQTCGLPTGSFRRRGRASKAAHQVRGP